ncbi:MAG: redoxin family protein [Phycisphaerales bacterium]|nr:redoxin family protein [Phycisphaerales bacterium]
MFKQMTPLLAGLALFSSLAVAQESITETITVETEEATPVKTLTIGDKAPTIKDITWLKGKGVEAFKPGDSYVVECWATWCGPCIKGIPHLTKLQKQYKGKIKIMGIAIWQEGDDRLAKVTDFVKEQGDKMDYTVGIEKDNSIANNWMKPAGQNGIPCAYLVDKDGRIAWIGHPGSIDPVLESYTAGSWDVATFAVEYRKQQENEKFMEQMSRKVQEAMAKNEPGKAIEILDEVIAKNPDMSSVKYSKFMIMLSTDEYARQAYTFGEELLMDNWDNAQMLNSLSWSVLTDPPVKYRDLDFAIKAAERANNLTDGEDASILDTLARAWFDKGDFKRAIELQEKAIATAPDGQMKDELKQTLEKYVTAQPKVG